MAREANDAVSANTEVKNMKDPPRSLELAGNGMIHKMDAAPSWSSSGKLRQDQCHNGSPGKQCVRPPGGGIIVGTQTERITTPRKLRFYSLGVPILPSKKTNYSYRYTLIKKLNSDVGKVAKE